MNTDEEHELITAADEFAAGKVDFAWSRAAETQLPPTPQGEVMVTKSIKWPPELYLRVQEAADRRNMSISRFVRECVEIELAALENDKSISYADAVRALSGLPPTGNHHAA
jgi:hypothetical protein